MREIKFRFRYSDGVNYILKIFTLAEIMNGDPFEVLSDQPLLKNYKHEGQDQYTGLKDKNGKEIYEGDIVRYIDEIGTVFFNSSMACFDFQYLGGDSESLVPQMGEWIEKRSEIIGNIYESPELIKNNSK